jgi:rSAM/selenodomain-associated transferase 2
MNPYVSVIIPVLDDADEARRLVDQVSREPAVEVILVDGGPDPRLDRLEQRAHVRLLRAPRGRARQMNVGAAAASGEWLLFLHADSRLPPGWTEQLRRAPVAANGGWFRFALDDPAWQARMIERGVRWRVRLFRLPYGDQGLFVRRAVFVALGGFHELPLLEDVDFVRRLVRKGGVLELPLPLLTSSRRWRRDGWLRRSARNLAIVSCYFAGVSPLRLARWYESSRQPSRTSAAAGNRLPPR